MCVNRADWGLWGRCVLIGLIGGCGGGGWMAVQRSAEQPNWAPRSWDLPNHFTPRRKSAALILNLRTSWR